MLRMNVYNNTVFGNQMGRALATAATATRATPIMVSKKRSSDYQYLQRSKLPTMYFQRSLPRLPIPLLDKTCERFLAAVEPVLTIAEHVETKEIVEDFKKGNGMDLQALLKLKDEGNKHTSYISQPWFDMYLSDRAPLPLNYNPLLVMKNDTRPQYQAQLVRAANLVISSLRFWRSLQTDLLEPEVYHLNAKKTDTESYRKWMAVAPTAFATYCSYLFKAFPLDMSQYNRLFGTTRIPKIGKDELVQTPDSKHILVLRRGHFYAVNVLDANGVIEQPSVILGRLQAVLKLDADRKETEVPLGVLTAGQRDDWARARAHLEENKRNSGLLQEEVDPALFCLCLDTAEDGVLNDEKPLPLLKHLLAGKAKNRWFDKSISLIVSADGTASVNFEHSWGDGVAVLRYFNEIYKDTLDNPFVDTSTVPATHSADAGNVRTINFDLNDEKLRAAVAAAYDKNAQIVDSLDMHMLRYPHINKASCKRFGLSPDSIMQLSFQLAYRQAFDKYVGTYESCSTAAFRHGRTETMRPCTTATRLFCEAVLASTVKQISPSELRAMIDRCSSVHGQLTKEAAMGQGFDRHLFALKHEALTNGLPVPKLYETEAYKRINYNIISTSTLGSDALYAGTFGPVVKDGLGVAYSIQNDFCGTIVSSYRGQKSGKVFVDSLAQALDKIRYVIEHSNNKDSCK